MNPIRFPGKIFPSAGEDASASLKSADTEQTRSPTYRLAFTDNDFMLREDLRPVRLQLELLKPDLTLQEHGIEATLVLFGSARTVSMEVAQENLSRAEAAAAADTTASNQQALQRARSAVKHAHYYEQARELAYMLSNPNCQGDACNLVVVTGGGPGTMEAANRGAYEAGAESVGLNIVLPHEQAPNRWITPELCFQFHYFAVRKMHFLMRAKALVACPGGFGTLDELFETLTLVQTGKVQPMPILLMGEDYWRSLINFDLLVEEGMIDATDLDLFDFVETAGEAVELIRAFYTDD